MRKEVYRGEADEGRALFARADAVTLALVGRAGTPILRVVNAVLLDGRIAFHGAPAGEKMEGLGSPVVASAHETIASIPSYFLDPARACPATTFYVSAQAHGTLVEVTDPARKARVLAALMAKYQPEGGHVAITTDDPLYAKVIRGLLVAEVAIETLDCKAKLGQNRTPAERVKVLEGLWRRGDPADVRAIAMILSRWSDLPRPSFLPSLPTGERLECHLEADALEETSGLLEGAYWLASLSRETIRAALGRSTAVVGARDATGRLVAFARALSDGKVAWIYDVIVHESAQRHGLGRAVMRLLLDHPAVRSARHVRLTTRDAMDFYRGLGFDDVARAPLRPWKTVEMIKSAPA